MRVQEECYSKTLYLGYGAMGMVVVHVLVLGLWFKC
jgi:hypothetical protein